MIATLLSTRRLLGVLVSMVVALAGGMSSHTEAAEPSNSPTQPITFEQHVLSAGWPRLHQAGGRRPQKL